MAAGFLRVAAGLLLSGLVPFWIGSFLLAWFCPTGSFLLCRRWVRVFLALGLGLGLSSVLFFLWFPASFFRAGFFVEISVCVLVFLAARRFRSAAGPCPDRPAAGPAVLGIFFFGAAAVAAVSFFRFMGHWPHGTWDAWSIWNLHARFLFRGGPQWTGLFAPPLEWSHPDYPYLLPALVARGWSAAGREILAVPQAIAAFFTAGAAVVLVGSVSSWRGRGQGWLAGLALLAPSIFVMNGSFQYADIPLSFFMLCCWVLALDAWKREPASRALVLAGAMAGFAAWTKNEGFCFCLVFMVARFCVLAGRKEWARYGREMALFLAGALPGLFLTVAFKMWVAPPGDYAALNGLVLRERLTDLSRYRITAAVFARQAVRFDLWGGIPAALLLYGFAVGVERKRLHTPEVMTLVLAQLFMLAAYFFAFVVSPYRLAWHLETSLSRLLLQLWPAVLLGFFLCVRSADERKGR